VNVRANVACRYRGRETWTPRRAACLRSVVLLTALTMGLSGCEWFTDFKRQPHVVTWESLRDDSLVVRGSPQGSVPTTGTVAPGYAISYGQFPATLDSLGAIANPVPMSEESLARGRQDYQINCAVCHGDRAEGTGAVTRYFFPAISLLTDVAISRSDGYIFGMMRNGRGLMPNYNRIEELNRWDVVNYVRALQGRVSGFAFETGPVALPGVNGDRVPGATQLGPNRWVPHVGQDGALAPTGAPAPASTATGTPPGGET
jgi:mono/diheme cytochrome c family protein